MTKSFYNKDVSILRSTNTGTTAAPVYSWSILKTVRGMLNKLSGRRIIRNEGDKILADYEIIIDYTDVTEDDLCQIGTRQYRIYDPYNPNEMNIHLELKVLKKELGANVEVV